jgi:hypothetical protein
MGVEAWRHSNSALDHKPLPAQRNSEMRIVRRQLDHHYWLRFIGSPAALRLLSAFQSWNLLEFSNGASRLD